MMQRLRFRFWTLLAACGALFAQAGESQAEPLRYKFEKGAKLRFSVVMDMSIAYSGKGLPDQRTSMAQTTEMLWTVEEVEENGAARIRQKIDHMKMSVQAPPNVNFEYDSASDEKPSGTTAARVMPLLTALVGAEFEMTMSPRGEVLDVQVPERVSEALQKAPAAAEAGEMFSEAGFKRMVQQGSPTFPEGDLEPGTEWTHAIEVPGENPETKQTITTRYRYLGQEEIDGKTLDAIAVELELQLPRGTPDGATVTVQKQASSGKMYFDRAAGRIQSSTLEMTMDMQIAGQGTTIDSKLAQSVKVNVTPAE
jgi:hypothetical protein